MVGPRPILLGDPRGLADRRVDERVADGLRPRALLERVPGAPLEHLAQGRQRALLELGEVVERLGVGPDDRHVDVHAGDVLGVPLTERARHRRPPVAALRAVTLVPEARHERRPRVGDAVDVPAWFGWLAAEAVA